MNILASVVLVGILVAYEVASVSISDRALPRFCANGTHCTDNECCLELEEDLIIVGRSIIGHEYRGICTALGHYNSECALKTDDPIPSGKPPGRVVAKACPCQAILTCTAAALETGLGICS